MEIQPPTPPETKILLLEDDHLLARAYVLELERQGYQVHHMANSDQLQLALEKYQPALLITDLVMPDHDGMEAIFSVLQHHSIPIIAISAFPEYLQLAKPVVTATLAKPLTPERLAQEVAKCTKRDRDLIEG